MIDVKLMKKAKSGDGAAMAELSEIYFERCKFEMAFELAKKSARRKNAEGMFLLGKYYRLGAGCVIDVKKSLKWMLRASDRKSARAAVWVAGGCFAGDWSMRAREVLKMCRRAAKADDKIGEYYLGLCYMKGIGVKRNVSAARYHIELSALRGFQIAEHELKDKIFSACA